MPKSVSVSSSSFPAEYRALLEDLRAEIARGVRRAEELLERQKVLSSWNIGRRIHAYLSAGELPRGAISAFYAGLSRNLGVGVRTLQQCEQFYRYFPKFKHHPRLKWSHYRFLLAEPDERIRKDWLARIIKEKMSSGDLRLLLTPPDSAGVSAASLPPEPVRGKLYAYRILRADDIAGFAEPWFVDLGFAGRREAPPSSGTLDNKYFYLSEKTEHGYCLKTGDLHADELFTFRGQCRRVIDGDTLLVLVDQGFGVWSQQRLRLAGIDAPELSTLPGQRARKWVQDALKGCVDVVVKTYKSDKWDRYLVDVFYYPGESDPRRVAAEGIWLNRQMLQEGVATVWQG